MWMYSTKNYIKFVLFKDTWESTNQVIIAYTDPNLK